MADAKEKGIGIILITDELRAIGMADRIIVMNNGKIAKSISRARASPKNPL